MDNPLEDLKARLDDRNLSEVARRAGVAYKTVHSLAAGSRGGIYIDTYERISVALDSMDAEAGSHGI